MAKKRSKKSRLNPRLLALFAGVVLLGGIYLYESITHTTIKNSSAQILSQLEPTPTVIITPSPSPIPPSPTPTTAPTPTPYSGYCLYVPILFYHHIQPQAEANAKGQTSLSVDNGAFDNQMAYLAQNGYATITAQQLVDALINKTGLPLKSIMITLDDGYKDNYTYAHPVIQKYGLTANLMIASGLMGGADYLTWDMVSEMKNSGRWYFTNHTWSHFSLASGDEGKISYEIKTAREQIESHTGQTTDILTYPYGSFSPKVVQIAAQLGVKGAFSTIGGTMQCDSIIMQLRRTRIGNSPLSSYGF